MITSHPMLKHISRVRLGRRTLIYAAKRLCSIKAVPPPTTPSSISQNFVYMSVPYELLKLHRYHNAERLRHKKCKNIFDKWPSTALNTGTPNIYRQNCQKKPSSAEKNLPIILLDLTGSTQNYFYPLNLKMLLYIPGTDFPNLH